MDQVHTKQLQEWVRGLRSGDTTAQDKLLQFACDRLHRLTRKMLRSREDVHRWEETDDVFQNAVMRLLRALQETTPESLEHFFRLAAVQIRRELIDLSRHYYGPSGLGAHYTTGGENLSSRSGSAVPSDRPDTTQNSERLSQWTEFHEQVARLPEDEKVVFECIWYAGLSQAEAAQALNISERTLQRRWQSARLRLHEQLGGQLPE